MVNLFQSCFIITHPLVMLTKQNFHHTCRESFKAYRMKIPLLDLEIFKLGVICMDMVDFYTIIYHDILLSVYP